MDNGNGLIWKRVQIIDLFHIIAAQPPSPQLLTGSFRKGYCLINIISQSLSIQDYK